MLCLSVSREASGESCLRIGKRAREPQGILGNVYANEALFRTLVLELLRTAPCSTLLYKGNLK
jgi:hypothetical protein